MMLFLTTLLSGCQNKPQVFIPPCYVPEQLKTGAQWRDLLEKYIETRASLVLCAEKVSKHNERLD